MPSRIQLSRRRGWRLPDNAVSVARPTRWGNPVRIGVDGGAPAGGARLRGWVQADPARVAAARAALRGRDLACWCAPHAPCHADVLLELANP